MSVLKDREDLPRSAAVTLFTKKRRRHSGLAGVSPSFWG
jgi:hypothetical protein